MKPQHQMRLTSQRRVILETVKQSDSHPTADEVYRLVRRRLPRISLATVYRNLETLSKHGLIRKLEMAGTQKRFDGKTSKHYHVRCLECGQTDDVIMDPIEHLDDVVGELSNYNIAGHRLEFFGLCPECKKNEQSK